MVYALFFFFFRMRLGQMILHTQQSCFYFKQNGVGVMVLYRRLLDVSDLLVFMTFFILKLYLST